MNVPNYAVEGSASQGVAPKSSPTMSKLIESFLEYAQYELNFCPQTIIKYRSSLRCFVRDIGDKSVEEFDVADFVHLKKIMMERGVGESRIASIVYATRSFMTYCKNFLNLDVVNPKSIRPPRRYKREVIYLKKEEIEAFINTIDVSTWNGLRFRALVEVLLGTGMRIGEVLSLNRKSIDWNKREAKIIGKGNKERTVFFTNRSLEWVSKYLERRNDHHEAIFVTKKPTARLQRDDVWHFFDYHRRKAHINKKLTPHILRHTVATNLIFNGCPIVHVKEILGHERLDTTCKYYLGVDKEKAKEAHRQFLNYV